MELVRFADSATKFVPLKMYGALDMKSFLIWNFSFRFLLFEAFKLALIWPKWINDFQKLQGHWKKYFYNFKTVSSSFINSSLFTEIFPMSFEKLSHYKKAFPSIKTYLQLLNDNRNLPNGFSSDYCLAKVFNDCRSNEVCRKIEDVEESSFGYPQTHKFELKISFYYPNTINFFIFRLLYHLLDHVTCKSHKIAEISRICSRIYHESVFISSKTSLVPELKDLFMEQIFLCSFAGFGEFLNNDWIEKILSWQKRSGCFSYDNVMCSSHMNGLAAASFALFARKLDEVYEIWISWTFII